MISHQLVISLYSRDSQLADGLLLRVHDTMPFGRIGSRHPELTDSTRGMATAGSTSN